MPCQTALSRAAHERSRRTGESSLVLQRTISCRVSFAVRVAQACSRKPNKAWLSFENLLFTEGFHRLIEGRGISDLQKAAEEVFSNLVLKA